MQNTRRFLMLVLLAAAAPAVGAEGGDVAIVVRPDVPVDNLPFAELRRLMRGERQFWNSSLRVTLLVRNIGLQRSSAQRRQQDRALSTPPKWPPNYVAPFPVRSRSWTRPRFQRDSKF
jgi:hypothetical protein